MLLVGILLAALIGLSLGLLGGGGSILTVPVFVYVLGYDAKSAIGMSLLVVALTSLVGATGHWRAGRVDLRMALLFGGVAMLGSVIGARLAIWLTGAFQLTLFALVMLIAAAFMLRGRPAGRELEPALDARALVTLALAGLGVGVLTGLVGVGGGFLIVPALVLVAGLPMKQAVGTSLLVIAMNATAAFVGYADQVQIAWDVVLAFTAIAIVGSLVGMRLVRYVSQAGLRQSFAVFLVVMGAFVLFQNRAVFLLG